MRERVVYIKFVHSDDVYALDCAHGLVPPGEPEPILVCPRCGDSLYVPVMLPEESVIQQPMGEIYRPFPRELPSLVIRGEQQLPSIEVRKSVSWEEKRRLLQFRGMAFVDDTGFQLQIMGWSSGPVRHECGLG